MWLGGFLGRTIGGMLGGALKVLADQMVESQRESRDVYETASIRVQSNAELRNMWVKLQSTQNARFSLGPVSCGMPYSQSTQSQSINGVITKRTNLAFPINGPRGSADVQVTSKEDPNKTHEMQVKVRLSNGKVIVVDGDNSEGRTIDVEWKDLWNVFLFAQFWLLNSTRFKIEKAFSIPNAIHIVCHIYFLPLNCVIWS